MFPGTDFFSLFNGDYLNNPTKMLKTVKVMKVPNPKANLHSKVLISLEVTKAFNLTLIKFT